ncbi:hypothetical protein MSM1_04985 [Mycobacterium sp. SM1]|nr:hypothetical protein [Mycobacterium sp. SM1]
MVAVAMAGVLLSITGAGAYLGAIVVARHRAQAAADLAALAGAAQLPGGTAAACARAAAVARQMRSDGAHCAVHGLDVVVTAEVAVAFAGTARATARAGPESGAWPNKRTSALSAVVVAAPARPDGSLGAQRLDEQPTTPGATRDGRKRPDPIFPMWCGSDRCRHSASGRPAFGVTG